MNWFLLAFISAVFSAVAAISQKKVLFSIEGLEFSFLVTATGLVFTVPFFFTVDYANLQTANLLILYLKTIPGTLAFLCVMLSIKNLDISRALPLLALTPGFVALFAFLLLGDSLSFTEVMGIVLLFAGTYLVETKAGQKVLDPVKVFIRSKNHKYVIAALFLFTISSIADRWLLGGYKLTPNAFMCFQQLFLSMNFLLIMLFTNKRPLKLILSSGQNLWKWIIFIAIITIVYRYSEILAVKIAPVALVLSIKRISVFFTVIIGGKLFKESNLLLKAAATIIIIAGVFLIAQ